MTPPRSATPRGHEQIRKYLPDIDLFALNEVGRIVVDFRDPVSTWLELWLEVRQTHRVVLKCSGVRQLILPELHSGMLSLVELELLDVSADGLEGIRYEIISEGLYGFRCCCEDVYWSELISLPDERVLWTASPTN
jgi:hypothetical protein